MQWKSNLFKKINEVFLINIEIFTGVADTICLEQAAPQF